jgi:hypothetical protein
MMANMRGASCLLSIDPRIAWKSSDSCFYCSEFCADSESYLPVAPLDQKENFDREYMDRLPRLLPFFQELKSNLAPAKPRNPIKLKRGRINFHRVTVSPA